MRRPDTWRLPTRAERMETARRRYRKWGTPRGVGRPGLNHLWVKYDGLPWFRTCDGGVRRDIRGIRAPKHLWPKAWCMMCVASLSYSPPSQPFGAQKPCFMSEASSVEVEGGIVTILDIASPKRSPALEKRRRRLQTARPQVLVSGGFA